MSDNSEQNNKASAKPQVPLSQLIGQRRQKLANLREKGINPFPYKYDRNYFAKMALENYDELAEKETVIKLAGRIMLKRKMGKAAFAHLEDSTGRLQIYVKTDIVGKDVFKIFDKLDLGDIVGVEGTMFTTKTGEKTLEVSGFELLAKALYPLPDKHSGLTDKEQRYRRRYVDLIMNPDVRQDFINRAKIISTIRKFLEELDFIEVETPILQPQYGGASARPFVTEHNALHMKLYMRVADELYLKRLIVGGFDKVWEFCKDFRNEGMDRLHNPEFSMVELYWAYADYHDIMRLFEDLLRRVVFELHGKYKIEYEGREIDFEPEFKRISMVDSVKEATGLDLMELDFQMAKIKAKEAGIDQDGLINWGKVVEAFFEAKVEPDLWQPTFITDFPVDISPLAKVHRENPKLTERFECFLAGLECGNAFSELNDPDDQYERFKAQVEAGRAGDDEAHQMDEDYIRALQYGMPPTGGLGFGIDRLVMILTGKHNIRDVILFPQMKPE